MNNILIYAVSVSKTRKYQTQLGTFSIHHLDPDFFFGFETVQQSGIKLATPEKALLDFFYLTPGKSQLFHSLPELEIPKKFNFKHAFEIIKKISSKSRQTIIRNKLELVRDSNKI